MRLANQVWAILFIPVHSYVAEMMQYSLSLLYQAAHTKVMACIEPRNVLEIAHELAGSHRSSASLLVSTLLSHHLLEECFPRELS